MSVFGLGHPLDVDLADLVDGLLDDVRAAQVEGHLTGCLPCRARHARLDAHAASPVAAAIVVDRPLPSPSPSFLVPTAIGGDDAGPAVGDVWLAGTGDRILVVVLGIQPEEGRALAAPVTFDVEAADDETLIVDSGRSPLQLALAIHPLLATEVPASALVERVASFGSAAELTAVLGAAVSGGAIVGASDPRLEVRQQLAERLGTLEEQPPDPGTGADAPPLHPDHVRSSLIGDLRSLRGHACALRPLLDWGDVLAAHRAGWEPIVTIDEVGVVLVVFDTPHGLVDDGDFDAARSVLTRLNATALVVLARAISDLAEVFDSSALNYGIDAPSGRHTPPRPLISGLTPFDAVAKFLDQTTGARAAALPVSRSPVTRIDVGGILREAAATAIAHAVRQGARFKIAPKRRGYESLADAEALLDAALGRAFGAGSVVEGLVEPQGSDG